MVTLFGDTCFLIGLKDKTDQHHKEAIKIWNRLLITNIVKGLNHVTISDFVLIEVFQGLQSRVGFETAADVYSELIDNCRVQQVTLPMVQQAIKQKLEPYRNHRTKQPPIGIVDAISLVTIKKVGILMNVSIIHVRSLLHEALINMSYTMFSGHKSPTRTQSLAILDFYEKVLSHIIRKRMTQIGRIFTDNLNPCASVSSVQSVFHFNKIIKHISAFICVHLRLIRLTDTSRLINAEVHR